MTQSGQQESVHRHSGWLLPAGFAFAIMLLSGLLLGWYLRPGLRAPAALTGQSEPVPVTLGALSLRVPANYIQNPAARSGGPQESLSLAALFPSWQGYSAELARQFQGNAPNSAVVRILIRRDANAMDAATRLARYPATPLDTVAGNDFEPLLAEEINPERVLIGRESLVEVLACLDELGERTKNIFILFRLEGMKQKAIAAIYGVSLSTVEKQVMTAVLHLAKKFGSK